MLNRNQLLGTTLGVMVVSGVIATPAQAEIKTCTMNVEVTPVDYTTKEQVGDKFIVSNVQFINDNCIWKAELHLKDINEYTPADTKLVVTSASGQDSGLTFETAAYQKNRLAGATTLTTTGWIQVHEKWYYIWNNGLIATGWINVNGHWYFLDNSGVMKTGWLQTNEKWYFLASNGDMQTGWIKYGSTWYHMYSDGSMASNTYIDGYYLASNGAMV